jgi:hypothetical protein
MKKYQYLAAGERLQKGDEMFRLTEWVAADEPGYTVTSTEDGFYRRPVPHTGRVQFLMHMSVLVPVVVDCYGKTQEEVEVEAGCAAVTKILARPTDHIHLENIDWEGSEVDEIQPETPMYRPFEDGDTIEQGDQFRWHAGAEFQPILDSMGNMAGLAGRPDFRKLIK